MLPRQRPRQSKLKQRLQYPSADKQVIVTFVLLVRLSFFVLLEIDQVLKGRLKWYEKSAKRKVNYKRSLRLGALKWNYYALQIGSFWIRYEYGIVWMLNPDVFSGDVTRSSPVLYHEYCIQNGNLVPKFSLMLSTLPLPVCTTHALLPIFPEEAWAL